MPILGIRVSPALSGMPIIKMSCLKKQAAFSQNVFIRKDNVMVLKDYARRVVGKWSRINQLTWLGSFEIGGHDE